MTKSYHNYCVDSQLEDVMQGTLQIHDNPFNEVEVNPLKYQLGGTKYFQTNFTRNIVKIFLYKYPYTVEGKCFRRDLTHLL